jgi:adenosine/AMP kinase
MNGTVKISIVDVKKPPDVQFLCGQGNFSIFTTDNLFRTLQTTLPPGAKYAVAMNEAAPKLVRVTSNDLELEKLAAEVALEIGASHIWVIMLRGAFPINVLNDIKHNPGVCSVFVATANPCQILVAETNLGKTVLGVVDGTAVTKIENEKERGERRELTRKLGYLGP